MTDEEATGGVCEDAVEDPSSGERTDAEASEGAGGEESGADEPAGDGTVDPDPDSDAGGASADDALGPTSTALVAKVAIEDERLATDLEDHLVELEARAAETEAVRERAEDLESKLKRNRADFQNYKKRAKKRQERMKERATEDLVENLLDVRDNLKRAVEDDHEDVESLRAGVEMTLDELDRVFDDEDVAEIDPDPGTETDPQRHEVMMQVDSDQPEGTVADVYQPGYEMGEDVLRAAQVTVSGGGAEADDANGGVEDGDGAVEDGDGAVGNGDGGGDEDGAADKEAVDGG